MAEKIEEISSNNLSYIAGFFDGEGCISGMIHKRRSLHPAVKITISQRRSKILYWIQRKLDMGKIHTSSCRSISSWKIGSKKDVEKFINLILPYSIVKKEELIIGRKLNRLVGLNTTHHCSLENSQERMKLHNQLRLLKREGGEIMKTKKGGEDDRKICGTCKNYDPDLCYCPLWGEKYEEDTCDDWTDEEDED